MVHCTRCGEKNEEDAQNCSSCGAPLRLEGGKRHRREWDACFGVPMKGNFWGILVGIMIVLWGAFELLGFDFDFWAVIAIVIGLVIVVNMLRKASQP